VITGLRTEQRAVMVAGLRVPLSPTESKVLQLIIGAGNIPVSRAALEQELYGAAGSKSNTVQVTVCRLRQKLIQHGYRINSTRGRGYTISKDGDS